MLFEQQNESGHITVNYRYDAFGRQYYIDPTTGKTKYTGVVDPSKNQYNKMSPEDDPRAKIGNKTSNTSDRYKTPDGHVGSYQYVDESNSKIVKASDVWDQLYNPMPVSMETAASGVGDVNAPLYDKSGYYTTSAEKKTAVERYLDNLYGDRGGSGAGIPPGGGSGAGAGAGTGVDRFTSDDVVALKDATGSIAPGSGGISGYGAVGVPINTPVMPTGDALTETYGITQDRGIIEQILTDAVNSRYDQLTQELMNNEDKTYDEMGILSRTVADSIDQNKMNAIQSGFSKGAADAMNLSAILGLTQQSADLVTGMSDARADLSTQKTADLQLAKSDALTTSNDIGKAIAQIASEIYGNDVVRYGSELNYNVGLESALAGLLAQQYATDGQVTAAGIAASATRDAAATAAGASAGAGYGQTEDPMEALWATLPEFTQIVSTLISAGFSEKEARSEASRIITTRGVENVDDIINAIMGNNK